MKLFLVISDTHGDIFTAKKLIEQYPQIDGLIHLGDNYKDAYIIKVNHPDLNVLMVPETVDFFIFPPNCLKLKQTYTMTHGHLYM